MWLNHLALDTNRQTGAHAHVLKPDKAVINDYFEFALPRCLEWSLLNQLNENSTLLKWRKRMMQKLLDNYYEQFSKSSNIHASKIPPVLELFFAILPAMVKQLKIVKDFFQLLHSKIILLDHEISYRENAKGRDEFILSLISRLSFILFVILIQAAYSVHFIICSYIITYFSSMLL